MVFSSVLLAPQVRLIDNRVEVPGSAGGRQFFALGLEALVGGGVLPVENAQELHRLDLPAAPRFIPRPEVVRCALEDLVEQDQGVRGPLFRQWDGVGFLLFQGRDVGRDQSLGDYRGYVFCRYLTSDF